jgi:hypothetical protein
MSVVTLQRSPLASVNYGWKRMELLMTRRVKKLGHELGLFDPHEYTRWKPGFSGYRFKIVSCMACGSEMTINYCLHHDRFTACGEQLLNAPCAKSLRATPA